MDSQNVTLNTDKILSPGQGTTQDLEIDTLFGIKSSGKKDSGTRKPKLQQKSQLVIATLNNFK